MTQQQEQRRFTAPCPGCGRSLGECSRTYHMWGKLWCDGCAEALRLELCPERRGVAAAILMALTWAALIVETASFGTQSGPLLISIGAGGCLLAMRLAFARDDAGLVTMRATAVPILGSHPYRLRPQIARFHAPSSFGLTRRAPGLSPIGSALLLAACSAFGGWIFVLDQLTTADAALLTPIVGWLSSCVGFASLGWAEARAAHRRPGAGRGWLIGRIKVHSWLLAIRPAVPSLLIVLCLGLALSGSEIMVLPAVVLLAYRLARLAVLRVGRGLERESSFVLAAGRGVLWSTLCWIPLSIAMAVALVILR